MKPYALVEFDQLDSTNRYVLANIRNLKHGDVVQARVQTAGRGRWNRSWVSDAPGNLCLSIVIKPSVTSREQLPSLSHLLAVCLCRVFEEGGVRGEIKWPNDVLVQGRKIAGILAESVTEGAEFAGLALGIGVNLNMEPARLKQIDRPATSLNIVLNANVPAESVRDALLNQFFGSYDRFMSEGFQSIRPEYLERCGFLGQRIEVRHGSSVCTGTAMDVDDHGALRLLEDDGKVRRVAIGEMFAI